MSERIASASATGGGTGSAGNPWTLQEAGKLGQPDDTILLMPGDYSTAEKDTLDVTKAPVRPRVFRALDPETPPTIRGTFVLDGAHQLSHFDWKTDGRGWIRDSEAQPVTDLLVLDCAFNAKRDKSGGTGIFLHGKTSLVNSTFFEWPWGDMIEIVGAKKVVYTGNDCFHATAKHSLLSLVNCSESRTTRNLFRNPWARALLVIRGPSGTADRNLVENNVLLGCDWNGSTPKPDPTNDDGHAARICARRSVFRFNLVALTNKGPDEQNSADVRCQIYAGAPMGYEAMRTYHNCFFGGANSALSFTRLTTLSGDACKDVRAFNNVLAGFKKHAIRVGTQGLPWGTWRLGPNLIDADHAEVVFVAGSPKGGYTALEAASFAPTFAGLFAGPAELVDPTLASKVLSGEVVLDDAEIEPLLRAYESRSTAPAAPLGYLKARTDNRSTVTDPWSLMEDDEILVGGKQRVVVSVDAETGTVEFNDEMESFPADAPYWLRRTGSAPRYGLMNAPAIVPEPEPEPPEPTPEPPAEDLTAAVVRAIDELRGIASELDGSAAAVRDVADDLQGALEP